MKGDWQTFPDESGKAKPAGRPNLFDNFSIVVPLPRVIEQARVRCRSTPLNVLFKERVEMGCYSVGVPRMLNLKCTFPPEVILVPDQTLLSGRNVSQRGDSADVEDW
jgi:hypothetical protein